VVVRRNVPVLYLFGTERPSGDLQILMDALLHRAYLLVPAYPQKRVIEAFGIYKFPPLIAPGSCHPPINSHTR